MPTRLVNLGIVLIASGCCAALVVLALWLNDPGMETLRGAVTPFAHATGVSGVVLIAAGIIMAKLNKIERRERRYAADHARLERVEQLLTQRSEDDALVDALSEQEDGQKTNGHNKVTRLVRPRSYDPDRPKRT